MNWFTYTIVIFVSIFIHILNIILSIIISKDFENRGGFYLIILGLIGILIIQINDYLTASPKLNGIVLNPFEIISLTGTLILFLTLLLFFLTKKFENKITSKNNYIFYSPSFSNVLEHVKYSDENKESKPSQGFATPTNTTMVSESSQTTLQETKKEFITTDDKTKKEHHIKDVPTNGQAVVAKFIKKEVPTNEIDRLKEELDKVKLHRDKLVSILSHDFRTPLNSVFGYCQLLKDGHYKNKNELRQFTENIFELSKQQLYALNKIVEWTKYESTELPTNPANFDVTSTINFVVKSISKIADQKKLKIIVNSKPEMYVYGDEFMIIEVLRNLLDNAIKFSHPGNNIEIHSHFHEKLNKLVVLVVDSGVGINKEILMNLLVSTKKFTTRGTKGESGLGLGLLIVKAIIDKHGEHFWIASEEGKWTRVYFTLKPSKVNI